MDEDRKIVAIIPAAGSGSRMESDTPKQYLGIYGKPIIQHTIEALASTGLFDSIVVAIAEDDSRFSKLQMDLSIPLRTVIGGDERIHSVYEAVLTVADELSNDDWIMVHDSVRPCISESDIKRLILTVEDHPCGGILAIPVTDTIKRVNKIYEINETVDRSELWHALTPQMFRATMLFDALKVRVNDYIQTATDESSVMESQGHKPIVVESHASNIKVTYPEDLKLAENILSS